MLFSLLALSLTRTQALRSTVAGSPTAVKVFGANSNQVKPDNNAWKGGSEQLITWKFKGAVPRKSASTLGTQIYVYVVRIYVYVGHTEPRSAWNCSEYPINGPT